MILKSLGSTGDSCWKLIPTEGYDFSKERKQLAAWLFPEIKGDKRRGYKFDRAIEYLNAALSSLNGIRAQAA
jgi:hypothetical protein